MELEKTFTPLEKSRMRLEVKVAQKDAADFYQNILQKYAKTLQVPGFRKGKAPAYVIESKYGPELLSEARLDLINQAVDEAVENEDRYHIPLVYSDPILDGKPDFDPKEDFSFTVEYDVFPKTEFSNIEGFEIEVPDVSVEEEDVQKELENLRKRNAIIIDKDDDACAETGDIVTLTYGELDDDGNEVEDRQWEGFIITLGEDDDDIYGIDEFVPGMKKGETKEVEKAYPEDYEHQLLAGKTVKLKITVDELKKPELPDLDDELAQDVSERFQTLDDLKNDIRKTFERMVEERITSMRNDALIEKIVEANDFELPQSMIDAEVERRWDNLAYRIGVPPEKLEEVLNGMGRSKEEMCDNWRSAAERELKERITINALIEKLEIDASDEDIENEMEKMAERLETSTDEVKKRYADDRQKEYLVDELKERRLFERLLEKNTVKKGEKQAFDELFSDE